MTAPDIITVIIVVSTLSVLGVALDRLVLSTRLEPWRAKVRDLWVKLKTPGATGLIQDANALYCDLFDYIYGARAFSWKRIRNSVLSTFISAAFIILVLGPKYTSFIAQNTLTLTQWKALFFLVGILNIVPDFFSLMETRLILRWSRTRATPSRIARLFILDITLTAFIFVLFMPLAFFFLLMFVGMLTELMASAPMLMGSSVFWVPFLTTFVTSFFWFLFVGTFFLICFFYRLHPVARYVYQAVGQSDRPATAVSGFLNILIIGVYLLWVAAENLIHAV